MEAVEAAAGEEVLQVVAIRGHRLVEGLGFLQDPVGAEDLIEVTHQVEELWGTLFQGFAGVENGCTVKIVVEILH